jgi:hypothetical protein
VNGHALSGCRDGLQIGCEPVVGLLLLPHHRDLKANGADPAI